MKVIRIQTPIYLSNFNKWNRSFKCTASDCQELKVYLFYSSGFDRCSEIGIKLKSNGDTISFNFSKKLIKTIDLNELIKNVMNQIDNLKEYVE